MNFIRLTNQDEPEAIELSEQDLELVTGARGEEHHHHHRDEDYYDDYYEEDYHHCG
ncbi:MAG: hypothetical protein JOZ18_17125 [Chloroflexi bacterium]|nr:hypothetical protein [Chloroflexota bacterium]